MFKYLKLYGGHMSDDKIYSLSNIELLSDLSSPELAELASDFQWENYDLGSEIIKQGQEEHSFYILIKGKEDVMVQKEGHGLWRANTLGPGDTLLFPLS